MCLTIMNDKKTLFSIIIPARNEEAMISGAVESAIAAVAHFENCNGRPLHLSRTRAEIIVADNASTDRTPTALAPYVEVHGVQRVICRRLKAPCARNAGAAASSGSILVFLDADTRMPREALSRVRFLCRSLGYDAGIVRFASLEGGIRAWCWWSFWNLVRHLPLARAKAMPAFMFCTRDVFRRLGPFDETVTLGEEWPILAGLYRTDRSRLVYDRALTAFSSNRRMELQSFGYIRNFLKYVWAVLHRTGRIHYSDRYRHNMEDRLE